MLTLNLLPIKRMKLMNGLVLSNYKYNDLEQSNNSQRLRILIKSYSIKQLRIEQLMKKSLNKQKTIWHGMKQEEMKLLERLMHSKTTNASAINSLLNQLNITKKLLKSSNF
jgi:hypothetical protein